MLYYPISLMLKNARIAVWKMAVTKIGVKLNHIQFMLMSKIHKEQSEFQETEYFKEKAKESSKIRAKNSEVKHSNGCDFPISSGLFGMEIQGY